MGNSDSPTPATGSRGEVVEGYEKLDAPARARVNETIARSTHSRKWAYGPQADPMMAAGFKALHSDAEREAVAGGDHQWLGQTVRARGRGDLQGPPTEPPHRGRR